VTAGGSATGIDERVMGGNSWGFSSERLRSGDGLGDTEGLRLPLARRLALRVNGRSNESEDKVSEERLDSDDSDDSDRRSSSSGTAVNRSSSRMSALITSCLRISILVSLREGVLCPDRVRLRCDESASDCESGKGRSEQTNPCGGHHYDQPYSAWLVQGNVE
jgi:hypothetical protein